MAGVPLKDRMIRLGVVALLFLAGYFVYERSGNTLLIWAALLTYIAWSFYHVIKIEAAEKAQKRRIEESQKKRDEEFNKQTQVFMQGFETFKKDLEQQLAKEKEGEKK